MSEPNLAEILESVTEAGAEAPAPEATPETSEASGTATEASPAEEAPTPPEEPKEPDHFDRSWSAIKAAEKRNLAERGEIKEQRREMESMRAQMDSMKADLERYRGGFKENPVEFIENQGMTFDDLAKRVINDGAASPEELIRRNNDRSSSEIKQLREELSKQRDIIQEQTNERHIREYQKDVNTVLQNEEFELLRDYPDSEALVFNMASSYASTHGEVLTPTDAARRIQSDIIDQLKSLSRNAAVQKLLGLQEATGKTKSPAVEAKSPSGEKSEPNTLTNALAATPAAEVPDMTKMSEYELLREAAKLIPSDTWTD